MRAQAFLLLLLLSAVFAVPSDEKKKAYEDAVEQAEAQAERTKDPYMYGDQNLKDAAKFLSTRVRSLFVVSYSGRGACWG